MECLESGLNTCMFDRDRSPRDRSRRGAAPSFNVHGLQFQVVADSSSFPMRSPEGNDAMCSQRESGVRSSSTESNQAPVAHKRLNFPLATAW